MVVVHSFPFSSRDSLNLLDIADLEVTLFSVFSLHQQCHEHSPLGVCMDTASGPALEGSKKQRRAVGWLEVLWFANIFPLGGRVFGSWKLHHEHILRLYELLLYAGRGDVNMISMTD